MKKNGAVNYPKVKLRDGSVEATVFSPDASSGYYRGARFDWSGVIEELCWNKHVFFADWKTPHDPCDPEASRSTAEEFRVHLCFKTSLGFNEAGAADPFIKIGVGLLEKDKEKDYRFWQSYRIAVPGKWTVDSGRNQVTFIQTLSFGGHAYVYHKQVILRNSPPGFDIVHQLKNTGEKPVENIHYCHNFFIIDRQPIGPGYSLELPFAPELKRNLSGSAVFNGKILEFKRELAPGEMLFSELGNFTAGSSNSAIIRNIKTGAGVKITGDLPVKEYNLFFTLTAMCPEPIVEIRVMPGEEKFWVNKYDLFSGG